MEKKLSFEFTLEECNLLLKGLGELPYKEAYQIVEKIGREAKMQMDQSSAPATSNGQMTAVTEPAVAENEG